MSDFKKFRALLQDHFKELEDMDVDQLMKKLEELS